MKATRCMYWGMVGFYFLVGIIIFLARVGIPGVFKLYVVKSGSMSSVLPVGSLVAVSPRQEYEIGEIITFKVDDSKYNTVTHRIVDKKTNKKGSVSYLTQGDKNEAHDGLALTHRFIVGRVWLCVPAIGHLVYFISEYWPVKAFVLFLGGIILVRETIRIMSAIAEPPLHKFRNI